jgi:tRNA (adenine57-N1/adenine58-N1)-methyltransferase
METSPRRFSDSPRMIEEGQRILLVGKDREYYVRAGSGTLSTDLGVIPLSAILEKLPGDTIATHKGQEFTILLPRPIDFFAHASRSGAPMLPRDIGFVIGQTGMNRRDRVLDAGTGSGIAAIYFGGIAASVDTYEIRPEFARKAEENIRDAGLENVQVYPADVREATGLYDVVHLDMHVGSEHVEAAHTRLRPGGFFACYTPFLEQMSLVMDTALPLFHRVQAFEVNEREMTRSARGTRPSTRVGHSGFITIARR